MLIVWGFKARLKVLQQGHFFCPNEGGDREYHRVEARKWFTFFWIPVIPLKVLGEYIECTACKASYDPRVLELPTTSDLEGRLSNAVRHVVVAMLKADGFVDSSERETAVAVVNELGHAEYDLGSLDRDLEELQVSDLENELIGVSQMLSPDGKETLLEAAVKLAAADGTIEERETEILVRSGQSLGMSAAHVRGVLSQVLDTKN